MKTQKIPEATIIRLSVYSRYLAQIDRRGTITISSGEIAKDTGVTSAQVRKDLAYFGEFGTRGVGYNVRDLYWHLIKILGLNISWPVVIIGAGNLGAALSTYGGFRERGFKVVGIFDNDPHKIGSCLNGFEICPLERLSGVIEQEQVKIAIIAVPAGEAQSIANILNQTSIKAILNFAPRILSVPSHIELRNVDLSVNLEVLTFNLASRQASKTRK